MSSLNVYDDLGGTDLGENILKLERTNQTLQRHIEKQEADIGRLCAELTQMKHVQQNLARNISELFKTAKAEIARKDRMIADLRSELDRLIFRRQTKRPAESPGEPPDLDQAKRHKCEPEEARNARDSSSRCTAGDRSVLEHEPERRSSSSSHSSRYKREELKHSTARTPRDERYGSSRRRSPRPRRHRSRSRGRRGDNRKAKDADASEPKPSTDVFTPNNNKSDNSVVPQDDVVDSTVPSLPSKTTEAEFVGGGAPETDAVRESVKVVVSQEPLVLKESCNASVTLSASITEGNGSDSVVCKKPVRRRRCVIQILD